MRSSGDAQSVAKVDEARLLTRRDALTRFAGGGAVLIGAPAVLAACGGSSAGSGASTVATRAAKKGGTLSFAAAQGISQLDPYKRLFVWEYQSTSLMFTGLTQFTKAGGIDPQPGMAESWTVSPDLRTYTFRLRPDLATSTGQPITSEVVAASLRRGLDPATALAEAIYLPVDHISTPDARTVILRLTTPSVTVPITLAVFPITGPGVAGAHGAVPTTGPFQVESFQPNNDVSLVPNKHWWGAPPVLSEIHVLTEQDNTSAVTSLRSGQVTALWGVPYSGLATLKHDSSISITTSEQPNTPHYYALDCSHSPFDQLQARQALAHAIDRPVIRDTAYAGYGDIPGPNVPAPTANPLFDSGLSGYGFDLDKAKSLFRAAGVSSGDTLVFWATAVTYPEWTVAGEILQSDLAKIGIKLQVRQVEVNTWAARFYPKGHSYPNLVVPNFASGQSGIRALDVFDPAHYEGNWTEPAVGNLIARAETTTNSTQLRQMYDQIQSAINSQVPGVVLMLLDTPLVAQAGVQGTWFDPFGYVHLENASFSA